MNSIDINTDNIDLSAAIQSQSVPTLETYNHKKTSPAHKMSTLPLELPSIDAHREERRKFSEKLEQDSEFREKYINELQEKKRANFDECLKKHGDRTCFDHDDDENNALMPNSKCTEEHNNILPDLNTTQKGIFISHVTNLTLNLHL
jgi:uncharacterized protein YeaO (DUF488 family)